MILHSTDVKCCMKARLKEVHGMVNVGGHSSTGRVHAGWLPNLLLLAGKLRAAQIPDDTLTSGLELMWYHEYLLLAHSYVFNPWCSWIKATPDGKTLDGKSHGGLCTAAHSGPVDHLLGCGHGNLVHHTALGERGCFWGSDTQVRLGRLGGGWMPEIVFHSSAGDEMQCKTAVRGNPSSYGPSVSAL